MTMQMYFKVRSIFRNSQQTTLTLDPVEWVKDSETEQVDDGEGGMTAAWEDALPTDKGAEPYEPGGKATELRFDGNYPADIGDFLTVTIAPTPLEPSPKEQKNDGK